MQEYKEWQLQAIALANTETVSWRDIARMLEKSKSTVSDFLRKYFKAVELEEWEYLKESCVEIPEDVRTVEQVHNFLDKLIAEHNVKEHENQRILFISDMHIPYHHPNTIPFLKMLKEKYNPTRVICLGDETDKHALSFHDSDPDLMSAGDELRAALPVIAELHELFPVMDIIDSNHGSMVWRKAKHHGIPRHYIKSYNEVLGVGEGWKWHNDMTIVLPNETKVYIHHGKSSDAIKTSQAMGMSHVCGHFHESFGVKYWANPNGLFFAVNAGCLIDDDNYAFAYNNVNLKRPIIGTALIIDGNPVMEAMAL